LLFPQQLLQQHIGTTKSSRWLNTRITTKDSDVQDWLAPDKVDKRTPQLPPINLDAESLTSPCMPLDGGLL
jgi:hypothetical protein